MPAAEDADFAWWAAAVAAAALRLLGGDTVLLLVPHGDAQAVYQVR